MLHHRGLAQPQSRPLKTALLIFQSRTKDRKRGDMFQRRGEERRGEERRGEERVKKRKQGQGRWGFLCQTTQRKIPTPACLTITTTKTCFPPSSFWKENPSSDIIDISYSFWSGTVWSMHVDVNNSAHRVRQPRSVRSQTASFSWNCARGKKGISPDRIYLNRVHNMTSVLQWHRHRAAIRVSSGIAASQYTVV